MFAISTNFRIFPRLIRTIFRHENQISRERDTVKCIVQRKMTGMRMHRESYLANPWNVNCPVRGTELEEGRGEEIYKVIMRSYEKNELAFVSFLTVDLILQQ